MEKIYMEDNNNKKSTTNRFLKGNGIVTASVLIAIVAVFAFVATSFNNPSWAAVPTVDSNLGNEFTLIVNTDGPDITIEGATGTTPSGIGLFWANKKDGTSVFCLEHDIGADSNVFYKKYKDWENDTPQLGGTAKKYSVLYILANGYYDKASSLYNDKDMKNVSLTERAVITQLALWDYLYQTKATSSSKYETDYLATGKPGKSFTKINIGSEEKTCLKDGKSCNYYTTYVKPLVDAAMNATSDDTAPKLNVSGGTDVSLTEDGKYYQSSAITVTAGNTSTEKFKVKINDKTSPDGAVIVDADGKAIDENKYYDFNTKFYVRVPVDSVDSNGANVDLEFSSVGYEYVGYEYMAYDKSANKFLEGDAAKQKIVGVDVKTKSKSIPFSVKFDYVPEVPDTGMNTSQIIYFIGLVILVCGVGIVYANIKPKESN